MKSSRNGILNLFKNSKSVEKYVSAEIALNAEAMLVEAAVDLSTLDTVKLPVEQLGLLGAAVASFLPSLRTASQTITVQDDKLFRWVNSDDAANTLKLNKKDNNFGGSFIDKRGKSRYAKFQSVDGQTAAVSTITPIDPAKLMMAAVLLSVEQKLDKIIEIHEEILSFLEQEKEAEIEGDLKTLTNIIEEYKFNLDNAEYISAHYKLALDIKRTSEKNIGFYQKQIVEAIKAGSAMYTQGSVDKKQEKLKKLFTYYRISLYIFSFSSYLEALLLGNFQSDYIICLKSKIEERSAAYSRLHSDCYKILEKSTTASIDRHILNGAGTAVKTVGSIIGSIPVLKDGQADEWLADKGTIIKSTSRSIGEKTLAEFSQVEGAGTQIFIENLELIEKVYNKTKNIYIDRQHVYLEISTKCLSTEGDQNDLQCDYSRGGFVHANGRNK